MLILKKDSIAVMLLDTVMPKLGGVEVLKKMKEGDLMDEFPVIMMCAGEGSMDAVEKGFTLGICDFIRKPYENGMVLQRVRQFDSIYKSKKESNEKLRKFAKVLQNQNKMLEQQARQQKTDNINLMDSLGTIVEYRNTENHEHIRRVKAFTKVLSSHMMNEFPEYGEGGSDNGGERAA